MVSITAAVKKGDLIEIRIEKGALSVSAMVRAMTDGSVRDVIEVVNANQVDHCEQKSSTLVLWK